MQKKILGFITSLFIAAISFAQTNISGLHNENGHLENAILNPAWIGTEYKDVKGYCKSASYKEIEKHSFVLTPGRYVGIADVQDDEISFEEKIAKLTATLAEQFEKEQLMNEEIKKQLAKIGFEI